MRYNRADAEKFKSDWRNMGQDEYLSGKTLIHTAHSDTYGDHSHCEFCSDKISAHYDALREAYCTEDHRYWICEQCFDDLNDIFGWTVKNSGE